MRMLYEPGPGLEPAHPADRAPELEAAFEWKANPEDQVTNLLSRLSTRCGCSAARPRGTNAHLAKADQAAKTSS